MLSSADKQKGHFFLFLFASLNWNRCLKFVHSAQTHDAMHVRPQKQQKKNLVFFGLIYLSKNWQNGNCKVGFDVPPYRLWTCHLSCKKETSCPLGQRATISVGFCTVLMLHCQTSTSTVHDDSSNLNKVLKLLFWEWYIIQGKWYIIYASFKLIFYSVNTTHFA